MGVLVLTDKPCTVEVFLGLMVNCLTHVARTRPVGQGNRGTAGVRFKLWWQRSACVLEQLGKAVNACI
ncbi:MAG TPA: hypothetical protein DEF45_20430 [Rhodopirellula sp.]|nr:hypothetical protein [Rhodopirellula sp.]